MTGGFKTRIGRRLLTLAALAATASLVPGCAFAALAGGMAESYRRTGSTTVPAQYEGVRDKSYAVVVTADRFIETQHPGLVARINQRINDRLADPANGVGASAYIPSQTLLNVLYNTPHWPAMTRGELAEMLGVERLIVVELLEYRLNEPGNMHVWDGIAAGSVMVFESDSPIPDDIMFERSIRVTFPDATGFMTTEVPEAAITTELSNRFINRAAWLFFEHQEPNTIRY